MPGYAAVGHFVAGSGGALLESRLFELSPRTAFRQLRTEAGRELARFRAALEIRDTEGRLVRSRVLAFWEFPDIAPGGRSAFWLEMRFDEESTGVPARLRPLRFRGSEEGHAETEAPDRNEAR